MPELPAGLDTWQKLANWSSELAAEAKKAGEHMFLGRPDAWQENPLWACCNGHVSRSYLKSERKGALCLACFEHIVLVPPGTTERDVGALTSAQVDDELRQAGGDPEAIGARGKALADSLLERRKRDA